MSILLRFNPVASDLSQVVASINICRSLERTSDHAVTIAKKSRKILKSGIMSEAQLVDPLFREVQKIASAASISYSDSDEEVAMKVIKMDKPWIKFISLSQKPLAPESWKSEKRRNPSSILSSSQGAFS